MKYFLGLLCCLLLITLLTQGQARRDSLLRTPPGPVAHRKGAAIPFKEKVQIAAPVQNDSLAPVKQPLPKPVMMYNPHLVEPSYGTALRRHPYFDFYTKPVVRLSLERRSQGKERLFYLLAGLLFFLAIIKAVFNKYYRNLLALVFRASLKQKQIREQLLQTPLPSLLLNIFFVTVSGLYILFILQYKNMAPDINFWLLFLYCAMTVGIIYLVKFLVLKFTGWLFNLQEATDTYIFIVFLVNKLLGIFLLPMLILIAFAVSEWTNMLVTLSYVLVIGLFAYRYIVSIAPVRRELKVSKFHFFMYLCAFEIIPLLLIYKVLLSLL